MSKNPTTTGIDLTSGNILKNLVKLSLPIMLSNFFQTFYNLTDTFWLGKLGDTARNAVAVAGMTFPLIFFLTSFGFGFVIAGTSLIAQYKGAHQYEKMKEVVGQFIIIMILFAIVFLSASFIFIDDILRLLNTPDVILVQAKQYISVILFGMLFMFIFISFQSFSHGLGNTVSPMKIQFISVLLNVILDPLLIFGIGFLPKLEVLGAAYATLIARFIGAGFAVHYLFKKSPQIVP
ncbi:MAG: MATE family efflux transporter, partial [Candidatus Cloacimonadota bacterium]|nr:MATE family efflux transporter [Candidatus Cloacimonadota bacterium]